MHACVFLPDMWLQMEHIYQCHKGDHWSYVFMLHEWHFSGLKYKVLCQSDLVFFFFSFWGKDTEGAKFKN